MFILDLDFFSFPDPGVIKASEPDLDPRHWGKDIGFSGNILSLRLPLRTSAFKIRILSFFLSLDSALLGPVSFGFTNQNECAKHLDLKIFLLYNVIHSDQKITLHQFFTCATQEYLHPPKIAKVEEEENEGREDEAREGENGEDKGEKQVDLFPVK